MKKSYICDICGAAFASHPNNAEPVVEHGICCDECAIRVILERMKLVHRMRQMALKL